MISTGIESRVKIQQIVSNQFPDFVRAENTKGFAVDFLKQYYVSQEYQGGPVDITDNLDQYLKLDNLTPEVVVDSTTVGLGITAGDETIYVNSTKGFPKQYGLLKIDNEIYFKPEYMNKESQGVRYLKLDWRNKWKDWSYLII